jgi:hypothetical protein
MATLNPWQLLLGVIAVAPSPGLPAMIGEHVAHHIDIL